MENPNGNAFPLNLPDSDVCYHPGFFSREKATAYFDFLKKNVSWSQEDIQVYGKIYPQPRLTALYGNNGKTYSYTNITLFPKEFPPELLAIKDMLDSLAGATFTSCLLNLYRNGRDSNGWHADDEKELGTNPIIASVTLGQERYFHLRHKTNKALKHKILLEHGSVLLMKGSTQHFWQHQIAKTTRPIGERINLTFRVIA